MPESQADQAGVMQILIHEEEIQQRSSRGAMSQNNIVMTPPNNLSSLEDRLKLQRKPQRKTKMMDWTEI